MLHLPLSKQLLFLLLFTKSNKQTLQTTTKTPTVIKRHLSLFCFDFPEASDVLAPFPDIWTTVAAGEVPIRGPTWKQVNHRTSISFLLTPTQFSHLFFNAIVIGFQITIIGGAFPVMIILGYFTHHLCLFCRTIAFCNPWIIHLISIDFGLALLLPLEVR